MVYDLIKFINKWDINRRILAEKVGIPWSTLKRKCYEPNLIGLTPEQKAKILHQVENRFAAHEIEKLTEALSELHKDLYEVFNKIQP